MKRTMAPAARRAGLLLLPMLALAGCIIAPVDVDTRRSGLMPEPAARAILEKHLSAAWNRQPYGWTAPICGEDRGTYRYDEVTEVRYNPDERKLLIVARTGLCGKLFVWFQPVSAPAAKDIADALAALGARVD